MGLSSWKDKYRYQGAEWPLEQFVEIAGEVLDRLGIDERSVPNERLVRYYTGEGAMRKPGREGREAGGQFARPLCRQIFSMEMIFSAFIVRISFPFQCPFSLRVCF